MAVASIRAPGRSARRTCWRPCITSWASTPARCSTTTAAGPSPSSTRASPSRSWSDPQRVSRAQRGKRVMTYYRSGRHLYLLLLGALGIFASDCRAQLPQARLDRIFPLGGEAGSTVIVDIVGRDIDDVKQLHFDHPGLKAEFARANQFCVKIAADTPAGTYEVRTVGTNGISAARLF